ncbi:hypothetical protein ES703_105983 [subsurface metagenome]
MATNPEYANDRRRRDAHNLGLEGGLVEDYVEWFKTERKGYIDDWWLMGKKDFYDAMVELDQMLERDFSKVPDVKYAGLWLNWVALDEQYDGCSDRDSEYYIAGEDARADFRAQLLTGNPQYRRDRRRREAVVIGFPEDLLDDYVGYYEIPPKSEVSWYKDYPSVPYYEDDWFLMEHPDFYRAMISEEVMGDEAWEPRDFSKVPSREVFRESNYNRFPHTPISSVLRIGC